MTAVKDGTSDAAFDGRKPGASATVQTSLSFFDHFQVAADIRKFLSLQRAHHSAEDAAGAKIDFALDRLPWDRREPFLEVLRLGPSGPDELRRNVDDALQKKIEARIRDCVRASHDFLSFIAIK
jgi:hypothetical protein